MCCRRWPGCESRCCRRWRYRWCPRWARWRSRSSTSPRQARIWPGCLDRSPGRSCCRRRCRGRRCPGSRCRSPGHASCPACCRRMCSTSEQRRGPLRASVTMLRRCRRLISDRSLRPRRGRCRAWPRAATRADSDLAVKQVDERRRQAEGDCPAHATVDVTVDRNGGRRAHKGLRLVWPQPLVCSGCKRRGRDSRCGCL